MSVRVRIAPNPSGWLHVGTAHTALFNWLFARHHGGVFILRIEDTDPATARPELIEPIAEAMRWLGLHWDEGIDVGGPYGPYRDSERLENHQAAARELLEQGDAYHCYCTDDDKRARGVETGYDRHCRTLSDADRRDHQAQGRKPVVRLKVPEGVTVSFRDLILGEISKTYEEHQDPVIVRSDGTPLYRLAAAVDDIEMRMTHVIRGADLIESTPSQIVIMRALGANPPDYAHVPIILDAQRRKLSKRRESEDVLEFRRRGYLPEAMVNYLALLSWSSPTADELLTVERLVEEFTLDRVNPSNPVFDEPKLRWLNQQWIMTLKPGDLHRRILTLFPDVPEDILLKALEVPDFLTPRLELLEQVPDAIRYLHERPSIDPDSWRKVEKEAPTVLPAAIAAVEGVEPWTIEAISRRLTALCEEVGLNRRKGLAPIRVAISGSTVSLPLYESAFLIGRDETIARLRAVGG